MKEYNQTSRTAIGRLYDNLGAPAVLVVAYVSFGIALGLFKLTGWLVGGPVAEAATVVTVIAALVGALAFPVLVILTVLSWYWRTPVEAAPSEDDELRRAVLLADEVAPLPGPAHAALVTLRARLAAAQGVSVEQLVAKAVQP